MISFTPTHTLVLGVLHAMARAAGPNGVVAILEPLLATYLPLKPDFSALGMGGPRADLAVLHGSETVLLDVSVVRRRPRHRTSAAAYRDREKLTKYGLRVDLSGAVTVSIVPFSVETHGTLGQPALEFIGLLGRLAYPTIMSAAGPVGDVHGLRGKFVARLFARLSVALATGLHLRMRTWLSAQTRTPDASLAVDAAAVDDGDGLMEDGADALGPDPDLVAEVVIARDGEAGD